MKAFGAASCMYVQLKNTVHNKTEVTVRLSQGSLMVKEKCTDKWGRVCHYGDNNAAKLACQALGFHQGG